jgi:hypothetical protein
MSRTALICTILAVLVLAALGWIFIVTPYQAQRKWDAARTALVERGEKLSLVDFPAPTIRDEDNFFADPIWRELTDRAMVVTNTETYHAPKLPEDKRQLGIFRRKFDKLEADALKADFPEFKSAVTDEAHRTVAKVWEQAKKDPGQTRRAAEFTLRVQAPVEPMISRLRELAQRPDAWFPLEYGDGLSMRYDHTTALLSAGQWLSLHARALLEVGDYRAAFQDVVLIFRLKETLRHNPLFFPMLIESSLTEIFSDSIDRGIRVHAWTADELREFDRMLSTVDAPRRLAGALRMERALMLDVVWPTMTSNTLSPVTKSSGRYALLWFYRTVWMPGDQALYTDVIQKEAESLDAVPRQGMNPKFFPDHIENYLRAHPSIYEKVSKVMTMLSLPGQAGTIYRAAKTQTSVFLTRSAIALELYRLEHGQYPETLDVLSPGAPDGIPLDLITGEPFRYERNKDGSFALWSVGWNEKDEHGLVVKKLTEGDWVWGD